ncbi:hypothetical protein TSTA_088010 [Talaromyces stipitatus ATCC 10500]|uniref:Uncharacterized protein n=1 Tax=Talaromyces stipitatus (strain ATCC 10500 / CBS 375.48 / QM 6759 / NRRL 1006) TaxID=441959 RepID=B8M2A1_TALSN|nr:uncharacterized protein TSTA_088010 [Talaromyces stipitatus ATCC 10500]EED21565.1 hypothetical protein TSTA_088010 [Talaromyces stipitatus ATCC 10500]
MHSYKAVLLTILALTHFTVAAPIAEPHDDAVTRVYSPEEVDLKAIGDTY